MKAIKIRYFICFLLFILGILMTIGDFEELAINTASILFNKHFDLNFWQRGFFYSGINLVIFCTLFFSYEFLFKQYSIQFSLFAITLITLPFYLTIARYAVNIPVSDDYELIIDFINKYRSSKGLSEKAGLIFSQYFECKFVFLRIVLLFQDSIFGNIDLKFLNYLSCLAIPGIACMLYLSTAIRHKSILIILAILIFQYQYHGGVFWIIGGFPKFYVILFSILAFYFLSKKTWGNVSLAFVFGVLALLTFANGILCLVLCFMTLLSEKRRVQSIAWGLSLSIISAVYFLPGYQYPSHLQISISNLPAIQLYSFLFLGNCAQFLYQTFLPYVLGISIWLLFLYFTYSRYFKKNPIIYCTLLFIILSSLLAGLFRIDGIAASQPLQTTYGFYSIMSVCCCFIAVAEHLSEIKFIRFIPWFFIISCTYHLLSDLMFYPENAVRKQYLSTCILPWLKDETQNGPPPCTWYFDPAGNKSSEYKAIIKKAKELNSFTPDI